MNLRRTLTSIVLAGTIAFSSGCNNDNNNFTARPLADSRYDFNGELGDEQVTFTRSLFLGGYTATNYLIVRRPDGTVIDYVDFWNDLTVDEVRVKKQQGEPQIYKIDAIGMEAIKLAQQQFDKYLRRIFEYKQQKAVNAVKSD